MKLKIPVTLFWVVLLPLLHYWVLLAQSSALTTLEANGHSYHTEMLVIAVYPVFVFGSTLTVGTSLWVLWRRNTQSSQQAQ